MTTSAEQAHVGDIIGRRYRLVELIGNGGMSVVWHAHDDTLDRPVAVKMLSHAGSARFRTQLFGEARAYGRLNSPRIAQVYDYGETDDAAPYLVMEYVTGEPLSQRLADGGSMPWPAAVAMAAQVADALRDVHAHGLVHRDVKPDNVLLTDSGAKLVDFGISALIGAPDAAEDGSLLGTPAYLAPERIVDAPVHASADVYAVGVLLFRALTGRLPWPADTSAGLLKAHMFAPPASVPPIHGMPRRVADICAECLAKEPQARPSSAELASTLWLATLGTTTAERDARDATVEDTAAFATLGGAARHGVLPDVTALHDGRTDAALDGTAGGGIATAATALAGTALAGAARDATPTSPAATGSATSTPTSPVPVTAVRASALAAFAHGKVAATSALTATRTLARPHFAPGGRRRRVGFAIAIATVSLVLLGVAWGAFGRLGHSSRTPTTSTPACLAAFAIDSDWGDGFMGRVIVTNAGDAALHGWSVSFAFPGDQAISSPTGTVAPDRVTVTPTVGKPYAAQIVQTGSTVVARSSDTESLAASQSVAVPIYGRYTGANPVPTAVALNGTDCQTHGSSPAPVAPTPVQAGDDNRGHGNDGDGGNGDGNGDGHGKHGRDGDSG